MEVTFKKTMFYVFLSDLTFKTCVQKTNLKILIVFITFKHRIIYFVILQTLGLEFVQSYLGNTSNHCSPLVILQAGYDIDVLK